MFIKNVEKEWLNELLHHGIVTVVFTKKDGTERTMKCTLSEEFIPSEKIPKGSSRSKPKDSVAVFDVGIGEWRSFRYDSIIEVLFTL